MRLAALLLAAGLPPVAAAGGKAPAAPALPVLEMVAVSTATAGDAALVRSRLEGSLASPTAASLAARLTALDAPLLVSFGSPSRPNLWGAADVEPEAPSITLLPLVRDADLSEFSRVFWHEACHAVLGAEARASGNYLWDLFFDDELHCYLLGEVVRLELGGWPEEDDITASMALSTAAFHAAMVRREGNSALTWEELAAPMASWRARLAGLEPFRLHAARVLKRVPVWRYMMRKVAEAGYIAPSRLEGLKLELDATDATRGSLDDVEALEAQLRRRLEYFGTRPGKEHLKALAGMLGRSSYGRRIHGDMVALQRRYAALAAKAPPRPSWKPPAEAGAAPRADALPAQAGWTELEQAYDALKAAKPECCRDEPPYDP